MGRKKKDPEQLEAGIEVFPQPKLQGLRARIEKIRVPSGRNIVMDFRIHSPSSLAHLQVKGVESAEAIVRIAKVKGLDMIAITDYNSASQVDAVAEAAMTTGLVVIPGTLIKVSVGDCREASMIVLFPENTNRQHVENFLERVGVPRNQFGNEKFVCATSLADVISVVESHGGIIIPSRVDKTPSQAKIIKTLVEDYGFRAFDLGAEESAALFAQWPSIKFKFMSFSNATALAQVGSRIAKMRMEAPSFDGFKSFVMRSR